MVTPSMVTLVSAMLVATITLRLPGKALNTRSCSSWDRRA